MNHCGACNGSGILPKGETRNDPPGLLAFDSEVSDDDEKLLVKRAKADAFKEVYEVLPSVASKRQRLQ